MKGLILSGGAGTRLRPITHTSAKQLVPVANKPILFYGLEAMREAGIAEVGIVVGDTHAEIEAAVGDGARFGLRVTYLPQEAPLGLAHAVLIAEDYLGDEPFVMYLGDNLLKDGIAPFVERFAADRPDAMILLQQVPDPQAYGIAELGDGAVVRLVEKPAEPRSDLALVGVYLFTPAVFDSVKAISPSARGELEITDAIQHMIDRGLRVEPHDRHRLVEGHRQARGHARGQPPHPEHPRARRARRDRRLRRSRGRWRSRPAAASLRCTVRGPVIIGAGCQLTDAFIGPYTAISDGVTIEHAEIEHSIILENSRISRPQGAPVRQPDRQRRDHRHTDGRPLAYRFMVGDSSRIGVV